MKPRQAGFGIMEIMVTVAVIVVGLIGTMSAFLGTTRLSDDNRWNILFDVASRNAIEQLRSVAFTSVTTEFGPGSGKQDFWFDDEGNLLFADPGDAAGTGRFEFFNNESAIPSSFADLAGGFDLNANGVVENGLITDYKLLPTRVSVSISLFSGPLTLDSELLLTSW